MSDENYEIEDVPDDIAEAVSAEERSGLVLVSEVLPSDLPILALRPRPFFPGIPVPMLVGGPQLAAVQLALDSSAKALGLVLVREMEGEDTPENLYRVGVAAKIVKAVPGDEDFVQILVHCVERFRIREISVTPEGLLAQVEYHDATELSVNPELKAYSMAIISTLKDLMKLNPLQSEAIRLFLSRSTLDDPGRLADFAANLTTAEGEELQQILETFDVRRRIDRVLVLLKKEVELSKLQNKITRRIEERISGQQREFFLKEQLKSIKKELGLEKEGKETEIEKFSRRLRGLKPNKEAEDTIGEELEKLQLLDPSSPEYTVTRNYLDWLTILPWGKYSQDSLDLDRARRVLDRDHYGLKDVKERILEFIAVGRLKGDVSGSFR